MAALRSTWTFTPRTTSKPIAQLYDPDGLWFDISAMMPCFCVRCRERMSQEHGDGTVSFNLPTIRMHAVVVLHHPEN